MNLPTQAVGQSTFVTTGAITRPMTSTTQRRRRRPFTASTPAAPHPGGGPATRAGAASGTCPAARALTPGT